uniref:Battenin n=1 Tax=Caenorhabditis japonica TaxID=281687 RepID=A0A8R1EGE7_CAEJA
MKTQVCIHRSVCVSSSITARTVVAAWSSGTGGAGIVGALVYALLTDPKLLALSPKHAILQMLTLPFLFSIAYWSILQIPRSVHRARILTPSTWIIRAVQTTRDSDEEDESLLNREDDDDEDHELYRREDTESKWQKTSPLLKFMIPLISVYWAEYYINQGLILNAAFFTAVAIYPLLPHILLAFSVIFFEGLLGGASYVNTFRAVHRDIRPEDREFSMGVVSISDTIGIVLAGFLAMPVHNKICSMPFWNQKNVKTRPEFNSSATVLAELSWSEENVGRSTTDTEITEASYGPKNRRKGNDFHIGSLNVRSISDQSKAEAFDLLAVNSGCKVIALQETKRKEGEWVLSSGAELICTRREAREGGLAFWIHKDWLGKASLTKKTENGILGDQHDHAVVLRKDGPTTSRIRSKSSSTMRPSGATSGMAAEELAYSRQDEHGPLSEGIV